MDELTASFLFASRGHFYFSDANEKVFKTESQEYTNAAEAEAYYESSKTNHNEQWTMILGQVAALDPEPLYRTKWNLAQDTNFEAGVIYMAQMNPKEPACFTMPGIAAWKKHDYHLAETAFEKAIDIGSPQKELLQFQIAGLKDYISHSPVMSHNEIGGASIVVLSVLIAYFIYSKLKTVAHQND